MRIDHVPTATARRGAIDAAADRIEFVDVRRSFFFVMLVFTACAADRVITPNYVCGNIQSRAVAPSHLALPGYVVRRAAAPRVLVFVHGLSGDGRSTWTNRVTGAYWPSLIGEDSAFASFDVYVYEYPTAFQGSCMSVSDIADDLRLRLQADRVFDDHSQVVFVAHSMGGLIVRNFLLRNQDWVQKSVPMAFFFGTPTAGSPKANFAAPFSRCQQLQDVRTIDVNSFLQSQQSDWFSSRLQQSVVSYCAFEVLPQAGGKTVDRASATSLCTQEQALYSNHTDVVKPECAGDAPHLFLRIGVMKLPSPSTTPSANVTDDLKRRNAYLEDLLDQRLKKREIREQLGRFLFEGEQLRHGAFEKNSPPPDLTDWFRRVQSYLRDHLDYSYFARFVSPNRTGSFSYNLPAPNEDFINNIDPYLAALRSIINDFKD